MTKGCSQKNEDRKHDAPSVLMVEAECSSLSPILGKEKKVLTFCQVSGFSSKWSLFQSSKSSCLSDGSCSSGVMLWACWFSSALWLWFCVTATHFGFWLWTTVFSKLSLTILQRRVLPLIVRYTSSSFCHWQVLHHWLFSGWSSAAQSTLQLHVA